MSPIYFATYSSLLEAYAELIYWKCNTDKLER